MAPRHFSLERPRVADHIAHHSLYDETYNVLRTMDRGLDGCSHFQCKLLNLSERVYCRWMDWTSQNLLPGSRE